MRPISRAPAVHVVDDEAAVRESLLLLMRSAGFEALGYPDAETMLRTGRTVPPCCVVADVVMPGMTGLELIVRLREALLPVPVVIVTGRSSVSLAVAAMKAGAVDFVEKPYEAATMLGAVRGALGDAGRPGDEAASEARDRLASLTARERDVLKGLLAGKINKVIGRELGISPRTVEVYRAHIMGKTGVRSLSDLIRLALTAGVA